MRLPPGFAIFETSPCAKGSDAVVTIGIVVVATLNARPTLPLIEKIMSGCLSTTSYASLA